MADSINHDGASTVGTVGTSVVKYGALGFLGAAIVGGIIASGGLVLLAGILSSIASTIPAYASATFVTGAGAMLSGGGAAATVIAGLIGGAVTSVTLGGTAAVAGGALGLFKGANQVSRESSAFRSKVVAKMNDTQNKDAQQFNNGEIKGIDEGYKLALQDMQPQLDAARNQGREEGAQVVIQQIEAHMKEQGAPVPAAPTGGPVMMAAAAATAKPPVQLGGKTITSKCETTVSDGVLKDRHANAEAGLTLKA